jgi:hypothetical protein
MEIGCQATLTEPSPGVAVTWVETGPVVVAGRVPAGLTCE